MAEYYYASLLAVDDEERQEGTGSEPIFQGVEAQLTTAEIAFNTPFKVGELPEAGLSDREVFKRKHALASAAHATQAREPREDDAGHGAEEGAGGTQVG